LRARNKKPGAASRPGGWRSFGEYAFLEDSRYAIKRKVSAFDRGGFQARREPLRVTLR